MATGKYRYYRLAGPEVARLVEVLGRIAPARPVRSLREGTRAHALRMARRCYDHLAGRLGVAVTDALRERAWIEGSDGTRRSRRRATGTSCPAACPRTAPTASPTPAATGSRASASRCRPA